MIRPDTIPLDEITGTVKKAIIPSQMYKHWANILDSKNKKCYASIIKDNGTIVEQINFCMIKTSFGKFLVSMPYIGYGSCFFLENKTILKLLIDEVLKFAAENDCLNVSISTHPLSTLTFEDYRRIFDFNYSKTVDCQMSVVADHPLEEMNHKRRMAFKNEISKIEKSDAFIDKSPSDNIFEEWYKVYLDRFSDIGGMPNSRNFFKALHIISRESHDVDFWVLRDDDLVIGGVIFEKGKGIIDYTTSAFRTEYRKQYPTTYVLNEYFKEMVKGERIFFNWQGSGGNEGVKKYKKRWGAQDMQQSYLAKNLVPVEEILAIPLEKVKHELMRCFVLPYELWGVKR